MEEGRGKSRKGRQGRTRRRRSKVCLPGRRLRQCADLCLVARLYGKADGGDRERRIFEHARRKVRMAEASTAILDGVPREIAVVSCVILRIPCATEGSIEASHEDIELTVPRARMY